MWVWGSFLLYHGRDFCALMCAGGQDGFGAAAPSGLGDGLVRGGLMQQGWHSVGGMPDAAASCSPALPLPRHPPGGQQGQGISSGSEISFAAI